MSISHTTSYNHNNLINNPPYITNTPVLDILAREDREYKQIQRSICKHNCPENTDKYMWAALITTVTAGGLSYKYLKNKYKTGLSTIKKFITHKK